MLGSKKIKVEGMTCAHCESKVESCISLIPEIKVCKATASKNLLEFKGNITPEIKKKIDEAISECGFKVVD